jgi:membrane fusion protein, multidrug efflux system
MTKRRITTVLIILAVLVAAVLLILKGLGRKAGEEGEEVVTDVAVHVGRIVRATLHNYVTAYGTAEPELPGGGKSASGALISSPLSGIIAEIRCTEGLPVKEGAVLFRLDTRVEEVTAAKARKALEYAQEVYERQKKLLAAEGTSQKAFQEAELQLNSARNDLAAAETDLSLHEIKSPLSATLVRLDVRLGQEVEPNAILAQVIALDRLVVAARVPSREAGLLKPGQPIELESGSLAGGALTVVGKDIDPKTDTVLVRASLPPGGGFQPGQFLQFRIVSEERRDVLAVPEESVVPGPEGGSVLFLVEGDRAIPKPVKAGLRDAGLIEVEGEGLKEGLVIVTTDAYNITGETKIHIVEDK